MSPPRGGRSRDRRPGVRAKLDGRSARSSNARVVWPPQARTESARDALEQLMRERGLAREFDALLEREAQAAARRAWRRDEQRRDLRELPTFTVDPSTARDFDDAISAQQLPDGSVRVWVHIADVAAHVPQGSAIDLEARRRATSIYVPGAVEPMLPHALSSGACSLVPGAQRLAVTVELLLRDAEVIDAGFYRSIIRSNERLDYEQVDSIFAAGQPAPAPWGASLQAARQAAAALGRSRERRGALVVESEEPEFSFDEQGNVTAIQARVQTESHRLIEHLMIAANEAVAKRLAERAAPCLYRVHERPDPQRIRALVDQLASLEVPTPPLPDPLLPEDAAQLVGEISRRVDAHVHRTGHGRMALSSLVLRSLKQAYYSPGNLGHAGLRSPCYCHFTSPIRRYPDLVCHRALLATIGAREHPPARRTLAELGEWTSEREREAAAIERQADDVAACFHLEQLLFERGFDQTFTGEITGLIGAGAFIAFGPAGRGQRRAQVDSGPSDGVQTTAGPNGMRQAPGEEAQMARGEVAMVYEGLLPVRLLPAADGRDWWELNEQGTILHGRRSGVRLRLGQQVQVRVQRVDCSRGQVDLAPADAREG